MPSSETPRYRFHGSLPPKPGTRTPVRASIGSSEKAGVATIRLYDPIDSWGGDWGVSAKEFAAALDEIPDASEIRLHINCPGGEVYEGIAMLNQLRQHPATVTAVIDGLAASAASFIAAGADTVVMGQNSQLMIHDGWGVCIGAAADMRDLAERLDQLSNNIASVYQSKAGGTVQQWRDAMLAESWYSADEAVAVGLADRVQPGGQTEDAVKAAFDLSTFKHQGRTDAPPPAMPAAEPLQPLACGCGPDLPGVEHKNECPSNPDNTEAPATAPSGTLEPARARHRLNAARHHLPL